MQKEYSREEVAEHLEAVARFMQLAGENAFKARAYQKAAEAVLATREPLVAVAGGSVKVAGIGDGIRAAMVEFMSSGVSAAFEEAKAKVPPAVLELIQVPGLGGKKALQIHEELGVRTLGELEYACRENRLLHLKGFGQGTQNKILKGLEFLKASKERMRLDEALLQAEEFEKKLKKALKNGKKPLVRVGGLARYAETVSRLEWATAATSQEVVSALKSMGMRVDAESVETVGSAEVTELSFVENERAASIWCGAPPAGESLRWLQASADVRRLLLEEKKIFAKIRGWEPTWVESEWLGDGVQARPSRDPSPTAYRVSKDGSVRGIFHCHTTESDGAATLEEMVQRAERMGYEYIGISDHSPSAFYAKGLSAERIRAQREKINALQKKASIRIFHGVESDILADGRLDYDDAVLAEFDFVIGSIHSRFQMDEKAMTERVLRALKHPRLTIWGHPSGRLLLSRAPYALEWGKVLDGAAASGVAIELNANPQRLDIDWRFGGELEKRGIKVCVNPDAHDLKGLEHTKIGEYMAEKAILEREQVLNLMPVNEMERYLWERRAAA